MNRYNPNIHHRRSIRLKGYDYSQAGLYFITICVHNRQCLFGEIVNDEMILNDFGNIAHHHWEKLSERFQNFELDVFQIMPNHMHGIIFLTNPVGAGFTPAPNHGATARVAPTVADIVGAYKSLVSNQCLEIFKQKFPNDYMGKLWQRNYHEHIIRDEQSYHRIANYIINNPQNWENDKFRK
ncbi:transposase [Agriterribacter sp.]|uniref:transposase n=1 Tax=Agriterribacter sp. TaxID=2821509 RepID=UPI002CC9D972|nr:transposase [Agriterribacter sp.]HRO44286.1 hypothetical protein [Agriterribacter sp.]HRQ18244.1 hypothetical protein [Agriterribacter sp.]